jgi:hypothetical protein
MKVVALILGGTAAALVVAIAAKATATPSNEPKTKPTSTPKTKPSSTTPSTGASTTSASSVPVVIAQRVIQLSKTDPDLIQGQTTWLIDNGWPRTADAVIRFESGDIVEAELVRIAQEEFNSKRTPSPLTQKKKGTMVVDEYGTYIIEHGSLDEIFSYASTATSIPSVAAAAAKLAAAGDTRALEITQHLADIR